MRSINRPCHALMCALSNKISLNFLQNAPLNSVFFVLCLSVGQFQMPLEGLSFVKTLATWNYSPQHALFLDITKIVCLHLLTFDVFDYKPL